jgi:hypothetical protein
VYNLEDMDKLGGVMLRNKAKAARGKVVAKHVTYGVPDARSSATTE